MRIKIHDNAGANYIARCYRHARADAYGLHNNAFYEALAKVQGQWLEVETAHLFADQFNTVPIEGVSELGLRVMLTEVVEIEDDVRQGVVKCQWCYGYDTDKDGTCDKCGKSEYLGPLNPLSPAKVPATV